MQIGQQLIGCSLDPRRDHSSMGVKILLDVQK
jgi:hypothetical protein